MSDDEKTRQVFSAFDFARAVMCSAGIEIAISARVLHALEEAFVEFGLDREALRKLMAEEKKT